MNKKNELLFFLAGIILCSVGLFILFNRVHVGSGFFGGFMGTLSIGRFSFPSGLIVVPFIISIVWMFVSDSIVPKFLTVLSILLIVVAIIMTTHFWMDNMTMFDWLLILVLIFGGGAMVAKVLFTDHGYDKKQTQKEIEQGKQINDLQKELEEVKKKLDS